MTNEQWSVHLSILHTILEKTIYAGNGRDLQSARDDATATVYEDVSDAAAGPVPVWLQEAADKLYG